MDLTSLVTGIEELTIDSRYRVVIVTAQRARHLMQGALPMVPTKFNKEITVALQEVLGGKVEYITGKEARTALKEARMKETAPKPKLPPISKEDDEEIKRDVTQYLEESRPEMGIVPEEAEK
jgi:DNA-directed RNA polymerase subunit omega